MSSLLENADKRANEARESLKIAEGRLNAFMNGSLSLPEGVTFQDLQTEVTRLGC